MRADDQAHKLTTYKLPTYYIAKMIKKKQKYRVLIQLVIKFPFILTYRIMILLANL
jgi:hypothetical protein